MSKLISQFRIGEKVFNFILVIKATSKLNSLVISGRRNNTLGSCADLLRTSVNEIAFQDKLRSAERKPSSFGNFNNFSILDFNQHATVGRKKIKITQDLSICMEEKSIRENSNDEDSTFGENPSKHFPLESTRPRTIPNISQLSMMNNIQNQPFPRGPGLTVGFGNLSILNNTSNANHIINQRNQEKNAPSFMSSPSKPGILKNQSVIGGTFRGFHAMGNSEKFYSAQKEKPRDQSSLGTQGEYKELIDTFRNYQGKRVKFSNDRY